MKRAYSTIFMACCFAAGSAEAAIPTNDAAQLTEKSETASTTIKLVPITTQRQDANSGVKCAVTTGKKAAIADPTVQPQSGAGSRAILSYSPDAPPVPSPTATGGALNSQTLFKSAGDVVAGVDASRSSMSAASLAFQAAGQQVGSAPTVMAAIDMNSAARTQNNLAWNGTIGSANQWVTALNALNLFAVTNTSRIASGMRAAQATTSNPQTPACRAGMVGSGTFADPCRPSTSCSTTPPGTPVDPACVTARYIDSDGNVIVALSRLQQAAQATTETATPPLSPADVTAALAALQSSSQ